MFAHHPYDTNELAARKAGAVVHTNRVQPHFGLMGIPLDMHMRRFVPIASKEKEPIRTVSEIRTLRTRINRHRRRFYRQFIAYMPCRPSA